MRDKIARRQGGKIARRQSGKTAKRKEAKIAIPKVFPIGRIVAPLLIAQFTILLLDIGSHINNTSYKDTEAIRCRNLHKPICCLEIVKLKPIVWWNSFPTYVACRKCVGTCKCVCFVCIIKMV